MNNFNINDKNKQSYVKLRRPRLVEEQGPTGPSLAPFMSEIRIIVDLFKLEFRLRYVPNNNNLITWLSPIVVYNNFI